MCNLGHNSFYHPPVYHNDVQRLVPIEITTLKDKILHELHESPFSNHVWRYSTDAEVKKTAYLKKCAQENLDSTGHVNTARWKCKRRTSEGLLNLHAIHEINHYPEVL